MANGDTGKMFEPLTINGVTFSNRLLRSSVGGRTAGYDGTVTDVWKNFEKRFADGGVGGIISTTFNVNRHRKTPLEYPPISEDKYVAPLARFITEIKSKNTCKYLIQIGDPGHATQTGLFPEKEDSHSSSWGFDLLYGYNNTRTRMSGEEIQSAIDDFANAAKRVQDAGADGIGLYRTEFLFMNAHQQPSESEQYSAYCQVLEHSPGPVAIRTLDGGAVDLAQLPQRRSPTTSA